MLVAGHGRMHRWPRVFEEEKLDGGDGIQEPLPAGHALFLANLFDCIIVELIDPILLELANDVADSNIVGASR